MRLTQVGPGFSKGDRTMKKFERIIRLVYDIIEIINSIIDLVNLTFNYVIRFYFVSSMETQV